MLSRRICRVSSLRVTLRRSYSQPTATYPFSKLQAFPFKVSQEEAITRTGLAASVLCGGKLLPTLAAHFFPYFGLDAGAIRPVRITPVYFPMWRIAAEFTAEINHEDTERMGIVQFDKTYIPGSNYDVLSRVNMASFSKFSKLVPFTEEMKVHDGCEVACLPFNISPLPLLDIARNLSYRDAKVTENLSFTPSTIEPNLIAAYPILVPLWLAQYEHAEQANGRPVYQTLFMGAHADFLPVISEPLPETEWTKVLREAFDLFGLERFNNESYFVMGPTAENFVNVRSVSIVPSENAVNAVEGWLESAITSPDALKQLVEASPEVITDEDLRIRPATEEELKEVDEWLNLGENASRIAKLLELMSTAKMDPHTKVIALGPGMIKGQSIEDSIAMLRKNAKELVDKHERTIPSWWKEWKQKFGGRRDEQT